MVVLKCQDWVGLCWNHHAIGNQIQVRWAHVLILANEACVIWEPAWLGQECLDDCLGHQTLGRSKLVWVNQRFHTPTAWVRWVLEECSICHCHLEK